MKDFGRRLKEERERIGLTQAKLAEACGVGKTAQYTYERGDREPSMSYMDAAEKVGIDTTYVYSGTRQGADWAYAKAYRSMLYVIEMYLGLEENRLEDISLLAVETRKLLESSGGLDYTETKIAYDDAILNWLKTSSKPDRVIDLDLFASIFSKVDAYSSNPEMFLSPEKKSQATAMLYRAFKASGKVDQKMIEEAVKLAAG